MKNERKLIDREGPSIDYTSLDQVIYERDEILKNDPSAMNFEIKGREYYYNDYTVVLVYKSLESDEEFNARMDMEKLQRKARKLKNITQEQKERAEYERLKKKFEGE